MDEVKRMHRLSVCCKLGKPEAIAVLLLNIFLPGWGTVAAGIMQGNERTKNNLIVGTVQYFTALLIVGWVWSIYCGLQIYSYSKRT